MPNVRFGIDHPVVTVRDLARTREQYQRLGFEPNPVGFHPWGTSMSLLMFKENFIELISVHDASKFGTNSVGGFCYGRNVGKFLDRVEGLGLVALHSKDAKADHAHLVQLGLASQGQIDFRRDMKRPDGSPDVAVVSLGLFLNEEQRDVSHFICHQHRPELIWVPAWMNHRNGVEAITGVTYLSESPSLLEARFGAFFGRENVKGGIDRIEVDSGCGYFRVLTERAAKERFGGVPFPVWDSSAAHGIGITVATPRFNELPSLWAEAGVPHQVTARGTFVIAPEHCGNVILEFESSDRAHVAASNSAPPSGRSTAAS
jgi:catechol 2,3-dioxygenase-like lactoylglutathione lyase family enzyme